jgi:Fe2+ transport system protein FeoA
MRKSELATQEWTLATIAAGESVEVVEIRAERPDQLLVHGLRPGARLVVEADAPFGGPRVVRLGRSRVAIDRRLARAVRVARVDA